jgi:hypothetical protein
MTAMFVVFTVTHPQGGEARAANRHLARRQNDRDKKGTQCATRQVFFSLSEAPAGQKRHGGRQGRLGASEKKKLSNQRRRRLNTHCDYIMCTCGDV